MGKFPAVPSLVNLEDLWMNDNQVSDLEEVCANLSKLPALKTVYLERNPIWAADTVDKARFDAYKSALSKACAKLEQVDALRLDGPLVNLRTNGSERKVCGIRK